MNANLRPAPLQLVLQIKRRLEKSNPGAQLDEDSVKLVAVPGTQYDATMFVFDHKGKRRLVAELDRPDIPHIYSGHVINPNEPRRTAEKMATALLALSERVRSDANFGRRIIRLNGALSS